VNTKYGIEKCQQVQLVLGLGVSYIYYVEFIGYDIISVEIALATRWIHNVSPAYQIYHDSNVI